MHRTVFSLLAIASGAALVLGGSRVSGQAPVLPDALKQSIAFYGTLTSYADTGTVQWEAPGLVDREQFTTSFRRATRDFYFDYQALTSLAPHPHKLELRGAPRNLSWPRICAHCGELASEQIVVKKAFRPLPEGLVREATGSVTTASAAIPFCARCATTHRATVRRPSIVSQVLRLVINPLIMPVVGSAWLGSQALEGWRTNPIGDPGRVPEWAVVLFLFGVTA